MTLSCPPPSIASTYGVSDLERPEVVERLLPPAVVADGAQHGLGGESRGGQHLHGLSCGAVQQVSCRAHRGGSEGGAGLDEEKNKLISLWLQVY